MQSMLHRILSGRKPFFKVLLPQMPALQSLAGSSHKKDRKHFVVHKCVNPKCPYYLHNLNKVDKKDLKEDYGKNKYKLHYIYREFQIDFFRMDLNTLPKNASSLKFSKHDQHVMSLSYLQSESRVIAS